MPSPDDMPPVIHSRAQSGSASVEDVPDTAGREALARLGRFTRQQHEQVGEMLVVLDLIVRTATDRVAEIDEILQQQRHRVGLGLRRECVHDFAGEAVIGGGAEHRPVVVSAGAVAAGATGGVSSVSPGGASGIGVAVARRCCRCRRHRRPSPWCCWCLRRCRRRHRARILPR